MPQAARKSQGRRPARGRLISCRRSELRSMTHLPHSEDVAKHEPRDTAGGRQHRRQPGKGAFTHARQFGEKEGKGLHTAAIRGTGKREGKHETPDLFGIFKAQKKTGHPPQPVSGCQSSRILEVSRQYVAPLTGYTCSGNADETRKAALFLRVGHAEGVGYASDCLGNLTMPQPTAMRQDVSEHRRLPLRGSRHRMQATRPRQRHARPCSPRCPVGRHGWSAQGHWSRHGRQAPAVPGRRPPPSQPICRAGSGGKFFRLSATFLQTMYTAGGGGQKAGGFPDKRRSRRRCGLELRGRFRQNESGKADRLPLRPAPAAAKPRGLFFHPCSTPPLRHQGGRSGREYPPRGTRTRAWSASRERETGLP